MAVPGVGGGGGVRAPVRRDTLTEDDELGSGDFLHRLDDEPAPVVLRAGRRGSGGARGGAYGAGGGAVTSHGSLATTVGSQSLGSGGVGGGGAAAVVSDPPLSAAVEAGAEGGGETDSKVAPRGASNRVHPASTPSDGPTTFHLGGGHATIDHVGGGLASPEGRFGPGGPFHTPGESGEQSDGSNASPSKDRRGSTARRRGSVSRRRRSSLADQRRSLAEARELEAARLAAMSPARERWHNAVGVVRECVRLRRKYIAPDPNSVDDSEDLGRRQSRLADTISQLVIAARKSSMLSNSSAGGISEGHGSATSPRMTGGGTPEDVRAAEADDDEAAEAQRRLAEAREQNKSRAEVWEERFVAYEERLMRTPVCKDCCPRYRKEMGRVKAITETGKFKGTIMGFIMLASIMVGVQTYPLPDLMLTVMVDFLEPLVQWAFVLELVMKLIGEGTRPWVYFSDGWNCFDFLIVVSSFLPIGGSNVTILRLLRLLRVLKLVKALPQLQMLVMSLLNSLSSIGYISLLMGLQFYLYAVLGVIMFAETDPVYFGNLHWALVSLWQAATGDDWSDHLYTAAFGCHDLQTSDYAYSIGDNAAKCAAVKGEGQGLLLPTLYFVSFQILAGLMLLNLFVGAIMMAVQEAKDEVASGNVLTVFCVRAEDLRAADMGVAGFGGASDPYVIASIGDQTNKTKVKKNTLNPEWGESFDFWPLEELGSTLTLRVFDWDRFGSDDPLGTFHLNLDAILFDREYTFRCELSDTPSGFLTVRILKHTSGSARAEGANRSAVERIQDALWEAEELMQEISDLNKTVRMKQKLARRKVPSLKAVASTFKKLGSTRSLISQASQRSGILSRLSGKGTPTGSVDRDTKQEFEDTPDVPPVVAMPSPQKGARREAFGPSAGEAPLGGAGEGGAESKTPVAVHNARAVTNGILTAESDMDLIAAMERERPGTLRSPSERPTLAVAESDYDLLQDFRGGGDTPDGSHTGSPGGARGLDSVQE